MVVMVVTLQYREVRKTPAPGTRADRCHCPRMRVRHFHFSQTAYTSYNLLGILSELWAASGKMRGGRQVRTVASAARVPVLFGGTANTLCSGRAPVGTCAGAMYGAWRMGTRGRVFEPDSRAVVSAADMNGDLARSAVLSYQGSTLRVLRGGVSSWSDSGVLHASRFSRIMRSRPARGGAIVVGLSI